MSRRTIDILKGSLLLGSVFALALWATGCGLFHHSAVPAMPTAKHSAGNGTQFIIESWMWIGIAGIVAGVVLILICKNDQMPIAVIAGGATALGISLALKTVLPWLPWLFGGLVVLGLIWLYARYHNKLWKMLKSRK